MIDRTERLTSPIAWHKKGSPIFGVYRKGKPKEMRLTSTKVPDIAIRQND